MEEFKYRGVCCPVCGKFFEEDDDIVVCPICGTPYHRECYNEKGKCLYEDKHSEGFEFDYSQSSVCPFCLTKNPIEAKFCNNCGNPIRMNHNVKDGQVVQEPYEEEEPIAKGFDMMAGVDLDEEIDGVRAEEMAELVGVNTPYYMRAFKRAKDGVAQKFNFGAFLFSGIWFLFRKQYKIGAIITAVMLALVSASVVVTSLLTPRLVEIFASAGINTSTQSFSVEMMQQLMNQMNNLSQQDQLLFSVPTFIFIAELVIMVVCGIVANKVYIKHCIRTVKKIREKVTSKSERRELFRIKGGVNRGIAFSIFLTYLIIKNFLPYVFM